MKRTALDSDLLQLRVQRTQKLLTEAGPDSAGEFEPFAFVKADKQRAEMFPTAFGIGISADYELLLQVQLDLDPRSGAFAGLVPGTAAFTDQPSSRCRAFSIFNVRKLIEYRSAAGDSVKVLPVSLFALRSADQILAVEPDQIKCVENNGRPFRVHLEGLQCLKGRTTLIVERNDFAVDNRVLKIKGSYRLHYFGEFLAEILLVARQELGFRAAA